VNRADDAEAVASLRDGQPALVWRRQIADVDTPIAAALKLIEPGRGDFLLESVEGGDSRGRYTLLGLAPDLVFRAEGRQAAINRRWLTDRDAFAPCEADALTAMRELVAQCRMDVPDGLPSALACLVGYFAYETVGLVESLPRPPANPLALPDMLFVRPTLILVFDRLADELFLVAPLWPEGDATPEAAVARAIEAIEGAAARLAAPLPARVRAPGDLPEIAPEPAVDPARYRDMVLRAKDYIAAGDIFQEVLAQRFSTPVPLPPFDL
jgi:anthranilate synthase component 1